MASGGSEWPAEAFPGPACVPSALSDRPWRSLTPAPSFPPFRPPSASNRPHDLLLASSSRACSRAYFHRFNLYRQHTWMCSSTGKTQLTYEEALLSERKARRLIEEGLPDIWKKALLLKANFSTERLDHVVDFVHDALRQHAFVDEDVNIEITQWTSHMARVVQPPDTTDARFAEPTLKAGEVRIRWLNQFGEPEGEAEVIPTKRIKRDRIAFSKQNFKRFLKENMTRELWAGSPLVIKPEVAARLGIPTDMPPGIQDLYRKRIEGPDYRPPRTLHAEPEFPTRFPVDDTQLHRLVREDPQFLAKHGDLPWSSGAAPAIADEQRTLGKRPEGKKVPSERVPLPQGVVADVLFVWNFLTVYCKPLNLYPFTFDDFVNALTTLDYRNEVMSETVFSLLRVSRRERENLVKAAEKAKAAALAAEKAAAALRDLDRGAGEDGTDAGDGSGTPPAEVGTPSAAGSAAPSGVKPALKIDTSTKKEPVDDGSDKDSSSPLTPIDEHALVNLEIDRHLTWVRSWTNFPWSAWSTHPSARGLPAHPCVRLKGWQAALMSAVVDLVWLLPGAKDPEVFIPGYWRIIGKMLELADREEEDEGVDTLLKLDPPPKQDPVLAQLPPEPIQPQQADAASASAADEADMSIFDDVDAEGVPASEESDAEYGPTGRKLRKGKRPAPTAVPAAAMDEPFHDPTKRRRLGAGMYDESRAAVMPGVASLVAVTLAAEKPQQLSTRKTTKKTMPDLEFLHICERGWNRLKIREKLGLLKFLIEEIVFGWEEIRLVARTPP
ncbi:ATP-utilizing chromatin assembly and remodelling N-terminal-domain-containing protein [Hyaloraphidium curvatum]|nr:ATP-utilizing chromatin assembly and remodelling N-terminal-domain-containing protein [Hyaloraphidium curvatum]